MLTTVAALVVVLGAFTSSAASASPLALAWSGENSAAVSETLRFAPAEDTLDTGEVRTTDYEGDERWMRAPYGHPMLTEIEQWRSEHGSGHEVKPVLDYNRVDALLLGLGVEYEVPDAAGLRIGGRYGYAINRDRAVYGAQIEQPIGGPDVAIGIMALRATDHYDLQQVGDAENSLALLFARVDYRDYFEREGQEAYALWHMKRMSTLSVHVRADRFRSLLLDEGTVSWFQRDNDLRDNPAIDEGDARSVALRLERLARRTAKTRAGFYHWIEVERAGGDLGGDFDYSRALLDLRSILRVSPATTLSLRAMGGTTLSGDLPLQRGFTLGGVDGLRAHRIGQFRGNQAALAQAEYTVGLWHMSSGWFEGGLHAIVFLDAGKAWTGPSGRWTIGDQAMAVDGGFGVSTSEDNMRVYFAHDLQDSDSDFHVTLRLQRPF